MKESNFYSDEFEELIRGKTEQYKMYPSEKIWKGVHNSLHTKRRWFIGSMAFLVTGILFMAGRELILPSAHPTGRKTALSGSINGETARTSGIENTISKRFTILAAGNSSSVIAARHKDNTTGDEATDNAEQLYKGITISVSNPVISQPDLSDFLSSAVHLPEEAPALPVVSTGTNGGQRSFADVSNPPRDGGGFSKEGSDLPSFTGVLASLSARGIADARTKGPKGSLAKVKPASPPIIKDGLLSDSAGTAKTSAEAIAEATDRQRINWLQDYALYNLVPMEKRNRTFLQFTLTPTVNYRTLNGGDPSASKFFMQNGPISIDHPGDAQRYVDHSPALGFTLGGSLLYKVTRNLSIKGGLQFNFSRYKIKAYASSSPQQATITLNSYYGYYMDSITSYTNIGNFGGKTQETLSNDYYQLSAPIGFELRILGNERLQLNIGATIQPSYLLNTNSYMLTSDYTNYTKEPSLMRRWNVSGGLEAFVTYKAGPITWQLGPEFRYQLLSTYSSQYPINENLKGYGLKFGIVKSLP